MLLIQKKRLLVVLIVSFLSILFSAGYAFRIGMLHAHKGSAETILFYGFVAAAFHFILSLYLMLHAHHKKKELLKLADMLRYGGSIGESHFKKFGVLGTQIQFLLKELLALSAQKSLKIAALSGLQRALTELIPTPVIIIDLNGTILDMTKGARKRVQRADKTLTIEHIFPATDSTRAVQEAEKTHTPVEQEGGIVFIPVFSAVGNISHFLVDISKQPASDEPLSLA
ncbi:hypothetical protein TPSea814_000138 [Treponema pallidum subsp. pallidum str. Sea 81-4]|nr:conserved hypothetical protein [Treponema pallidum subsp. pallidum str. Chicago]AHN66841.1 hypothetical protein TPSea814_000138 [Treponema pallidum subsp. pallidum str. Sea 81-4]ANA41869.1 putative membrane protein [Treponema pallidum subsp. pallidum]